MPTYPDTFGTVKENDDFPLFSASEMSKIYTFLNALRRMEVVGGQVVYSDAKIVLIASSSASPTSDTPTGDTIINNSTVYCIARWT